MKIIIIYDSAFGNTEKIARAIFDGFDSQEERELFRVNDISSQQLKDANLIIVGSPTQGFRPLPSIQKFLETIPEDLFKNINVAAFDTRIGGKEAGKTGKFVARLGGYAATRIASTLTKKGGKLIVTPEGFNVNDSKGPLGQGEFERASSWAKEILEKTRLHSGST
jgi:flavodoxin